MIGKRAFWDAKILGWEADRYGPAAGPVSRESRLGRPLRFRMTLARQLLLPQIDGKRVLEVGCGSARLAEGLLAGQPAFIKGIDLSIAAVDEGRRRLSAPIDQGKVALEAADLGDVTVSGFDYVVGLGVLDWLSDAEILELFTRVHPASLLFSISERRRSVVQILHRSYVWLTYGHRSQGYVPAYQTVPLIEALAKRAGYSRLHALRDPRLSFGVLLASWPITLPSDIGAA